MYKKQMPLFKCGYVIKDNENEAKIENRSHRYDINRPRPRHEHKLQNVSQYDNDYMY